MRGGDQPCAQGIVMGDNRRQPKQRLSELDSVLTVGSNGQTIFVVYAHRDLLDVSKSHLVRAVARV